MSCSQPRREPASYACGAISIDLSIFHWFFIGFSSNFHWFFIAFLLKRSKLQAYAAVDRFDLLGANDHDNHWIWRSVRVIFHRFSLFYDCFMTVL